MNREQFLFIGSMLLCFLGVLVYSKADGEDSHGLVPLGITIAVIGLACLGWSYHALAQTLPTGARQEATNDR